jgi:secondary thiamine-phosphate synthase enzyme
MAASPVSAVANTAGTAYRVYHRVLDWVTTERLQLINISERIGAVVRDSQIRDGVVHIQSLHTTTAVFLNEWQDALLDDMKSCLAGMVAREADWRHNDARYSDCERKNADSHLRGMLLGQQICLQVRDGSVLLGTWQTIILAEFDGPRTRSVAVQVSGI